MFLLAVPAGLAAPTAAAFECPPCYAINQLRDRNPIKAVARLLALLSFQVGQGICERQQQEKSVAEVLLLHSDRSVLFCC